jgi:branched-chain amino acid aminotransferase
VFEVVRLYDGRPYAMRAHLTRMTRSAANLRLPLDADAVAEDARALLAAAPAKDALLRMLVTRGGRRVALIEELPELPDTIALASMTYAPTRVLDQVKTLSYAANMLCSRLARERGADEALLVTPHGRALEAPTASFFWISDGRVLTPPLSDHLLDSITRRAVLDTCAGSEQSATLEDLRGADEAFLASSVREVMPVRAIDDIVLPAPGPVTSDAGGRVRAHIEAQLVAEG